MSKNHDFVVFGWYRLFDCQVFKRHSRPSNSLILREGITSTRIVGPKVCVLYYGGFTVKHHVYAMERGMQSRGKLSCEGSGGQSWVLNLLASWRRGLWLKGIEREGAGSPSRGGGWREVVHYHGL